jgi:hypothetical protein
LARASFPRPAGGDQRALVQAACPQLVVQSLMFFWERDPMCSVQREMYEDVSRWKVQKPRAETRGDVWTPGVYRHPKGVGVDG